VTSERLIIRFRKPAEHPVSLLTTGLDPRTHSVDFADRTSPRYPLLNALTQSSSFSRQRFFEQEDVVEKPKLELYSKPVPSFETSQASLPEIIDPQILRQKEIEERETLIETLKKAIDDVSWKITTLKTKIQDVLLFFHQTAYSVLDDFCYQI
jgi:hypothetical protein